MPSRHRTQHKGARQPSGNVGDWQLLRRSCLSASLLPACLPLLNSKHKAKPGGVNAQKHKATHQAALRSAKCGLWPRPEVPSGLFQKPTKDRVGDGEWGMGRTHPKLSPLCSWLPSSPFHPKNFLFNLGPLTESPCTLVLPSHAGCPGGNVPE